ncbi:hypothetical protein EAS56_20430 [Bradyrhizobium guangzhouense]|uniref:Uncharacterized protein n=1 Tax=Bradyrhizobium guangzhouense TaxID=1325095 RepID=A0AAE5X257_9BRAD|nr:hypothetical protein XH91_18330 [Bradyrhizobium guangzhouense]RXH11200.1 hypothetical protein EAS56_20430 [Bradyrhizobium guangzhouense]
MSLDLQDGECVALQGPSGIAKTLLLRPPQRALSTEALRTKMKVRKCGPVHRTAGAGPAQLEERLWLEVAPTLRPKVWGKFFWPSRPISSTLRPKDVSTEIVCNSCTLARPRTTVRPRAAREAGHASRFDDQDRQHGRHVGLPGAGPDQEGVRAVPGRDHVQDARQIRSAGAQRRTRERI